MSRLTERDVYWFGEEFWVSACEPSDEEIDAVYDKLKHYEDLEEAGRLVELPCKVGTPIWYVGSDVNNETFDWEHFVAKYGFRISMLEDFGKRCFLAKEEAEAKLAELEGKI